MKKSKKLDFGSMISEISEHRIKVSYSDNGEYINLSMPGVVANTKWLQTNFEKWLLKNKKLI
jgi:hypothetical protein